MTAIHWYFVRIRSTSCSFTGLHISCKVGRENLLPFSGCLLYWNTSATAFKKVYKKIQILASGWVFLILECLNSFLFYFFRRRLETKRKKNETQKNILFILSDSIFVFFDDVPNCFVFVLLLKRNRLRAIGSVSIPDDTNGKHLTNIFHYTVYLCPHNECLNGYARFRIFLRFSI